MHTLPYFLCGNTVRPYQVFYSKILATLLPVIYCKNELKLKLTKKYNLLVLVIEMTVFYFNMYIF